MKRFPLLLAALLGVVVSVPAQVQKHRSGRHNRGHVVVAQPATRGPIQANRPFRQGQPVAPVAQRGGRHGHVVTGNHGGGPILRGLGGHGHYETRCEQVLVPGYWETRCVPAVYGWIYSGCGHRSWGVIKPACHEQVWVPARYETQTRRVWVRH